MPHQPLILVLMLLDIIDQFRQDLQDHKHLKAILSHLVHLVKKRALQATRYRLFRQDSQDLQDHNHLKANLVSSCLILSILSKNEHSRLLDVVYLDRIHRITIT